MRLRAKASERCPLPEVTRKTFAHAEEARHGQRWDFRPPSNLPAARITKKERRKFVAFITRLELTPYRRQSIVVFFTGELKMSIARKSKKPVVVKVLKSRKSNATNALHEKLVKLFSRPDGATINDLNEAGFKYSARQALRIAERRGLKTSAKKPDGELTRYYAKKA
jgi:hypothetical protein